MKHCILGTILGIPTGYLAAMAIAALFPFETGLQVRNTSLLLALICCGSGAALGGLIGLLAAGRRAGERH